MKRILLVCCVLLTACYQEQDAIWTPPVINENVECCITDQQVHGAIYSALLKLRWYVKDKTDNGFTATIECDYDSNPIYTDVFFENTDKTYTIFVGDNIANAYHQDDFSYQKCIESNMNKVNAYIKKYTRKAIADVARKELNGIK